MTATLKARVTVWVDADSCPVAVRDLLNRSAPKRGFDLVYCANKSISGLEDRDSRRALVVVKGESVDRYLLRALSERGDDHTVLVTRDIPLAEKALALGVAVLNDRGIEFDSRTIAERRSIRDAGEAIRRAGLESMSRRRGFSSRELKLFADSFDRVITRVLNS